MLFFSRVVTMRAIGRVESGRATRSLPLLSVILNISSWEMPLHGTENTS